MGRKNSNKKKSSRNDQQTKLFYQLAQCIHHRTICQKQLEGQVTKGFQAKVDELNDFFIPAQADDSVMNDIYAVNHKWMMDTTQALNEHYVERISELMGEIWAFKMSSKMFDEKMECGIQSAKCHFGKRLKDSTVAELKKLATSIHPDNRSSLTKTDTVSMNKKVCNILSGQCIFSVDLKLFRMKYVWLFVIMLSALFTLCSL